MSSPQHDRRGFDRLWLNLVDVSTPAAETSASTDVSLADSAASDANRESLAASAAQVSAQADCERAAAVVVEAQQAAAAAAESVTALVTTARDAAAAATLAAAAAAQEAAAGARAIARAEADASAEADARVQRARSREHARARTGSGLHVGSSGPVVGKAAAAPSGVPKLASRTFGTALAEIASDASTAASAERLSAAAAARSISDVVQAARTAAALASRSATLAADAEAAAATLAIASAAVSAARAVAAALDDKAAVVAQATWAAKTARRAEATLMHEVLHDELTGLANRRLLVDRLTQALARSARGRTYVGVFFIDVDGLKQVNDTLGHAAGDALLVGVARRLQTCLRDTDTCARVGGDEFVVVCEDLSHPSDGPLVAGRLESAIAAGVVVDEVMMPVYVSVGVAVGATSSVPLELLREADGAMYRVKQGRRAARLEPPALTSD